MYLGEIAKCLHRLIRQYDYRTAGLFSPINGIHRTRHELELVLAVHISTVEID